MPAARKDLTQDQGTTFNVNIVFKDSNGQPVNLTGHSVTFRLFRPGGTTPTFTKQATVTAQGNITIKVADEETALWSLGKQAYQIRHETPEGDVYPLFYGTLNVKSGTDV